MPIKIFSVMPGSPSTSWNTEPGRMARKASAFEVSTFVSQTASL